MLLSGVSIAGVLLVYMWLTATPTVSFDLPERQRNIEMHLAPYLTPPTNRWFSSLVFDQPSYPVFAYPLAIRTTGEGFELSYPRIHTEPHVVSGAFTKDVGVHFAEADLQPRVESYDDLSVEVAFRRHDTAVAVMRLTQGSPVVPLLFEADNTLLLGEDTKIEAAAGWYRLSANGRDYGVTVTDGVTVDLASNSLSGSRNDRVHFFVLPDDGDHTAVAQAANAAISGTAVSFESSADEVQTTFKLETDTGDPALLGLLPMHQGSESDSLGSYQTLRGTMQLYQVREHTFGTPVPQLDKQLPLENLSPEERSTLAAHIERDTNDTQFSANDTYFGGKELYRAANLLLLARQLDLNEQAEYLQDTLRSRLQRWLDPRGAEGRTTHSFYYDATLRGIIGQEPSFGSEDFNDHHFHYGYFIYAAAVLSRYDEEFVRQAEPAVEALIDNLAAREQSERFPRLRMFDQYAGHSWASGFAPFYDGNNQESSSEAVNAWYAMYLWAQVTGEDLLEEKARWLYAREVDFALTHYLMANPADHPEREGYEHEIVSIVWGGKLDYATFFSDAPEAMLAIQLIPMSPGSMYLDDDPTRIKARLEEVGYAAANYRDYLAMYRAFINSEQALEDAANLADDEIDGANSRSYMYAWIVAQK